MGKTILRLEEVKPTPETLAMERILQNYGLFCKPGKAIQDKKNNIIKVPVFANIPMRIKEGVKEKEIITSINVGEIGEMYFTPNEPYQLRYAPTLNSIVKQIRLNFEKMQNTLERDLIKSSKLYFGKIESIKRPWFSPLINTINLIIEEMGENTWELGIGYEKLLQFEGDRQIDLLIKSRLVRKTDTKYGYRIVPTDIFKMLLKERENERWIDRKIEDLFVGYVIQEEYENLISNYNQNLLKSMARTCIGLYQPSAYVGHPIRITKDSWIKSICRGYNFSKKHIWNIQLAHIPELLDAEIVEKETSNGNYLYKPNEEIFEAFLKESQEHLHLANIQTLDRYVK